ncbi:putative DNA binding domain-containing protein [Corynebacterium pseudodiphtheriticum]|uniref:ATP-binding protein n=1 Tax=Corynebacterium pseudodiphtheriticum TaxID=37637 RepID=UPI0020BDB3C5|nr:ATP-binding protein [Corynebacterium pseudodiphtheriticum]UQV58382.1 putative DNA binding domain-containing protein [Corynebacterium pseudodiphtheriticum]
MCEMPTSRSHDDQKLTSLVERLINNRYEKSWLEFKQNLSDPEKIGQYISGLANAATLAQEDYAYLIWGIEDASHKIVGTSFNHEEIVAKGNQALQPWLATFLTPAPEFSFKYTQIDGSKVAILQISAASSNAIRFKGISWVRIGSHLKKFQDHPAEEIRFYKMLDRAPYELQQALTGLPATDAISMLDVSSYYRLQGRSDETTLSVIVEDFLHDKLISQQPDGLFSITNLGALLFARDLRNFEFLTRKAPRVIKYNGSNKIDAEKEQIGIKGYASGFEGLLEFIQNQLPSNEHIETALRKTVSQYPPVAIREIVANALIHQDFSITGTGPIIEIYADRIEITNPGTPLIDVNRFVDAPPRSRNERLAAMMRRCRICEERGSGWDRIAAAIEFHQLPAPSIQITQPHTTVTLSSPKPLTDMDDKEKIRAVYLHACLQRVSNKDTSNQSVRERFGLSNKQSNRASTLISLTLEAGQIVPKDPKAGKKLMRYLPFWAAESDFLHE